ncbi:cytochrome P450 monooxygenase [Diaporthe amygdali]|uniref:cytochrome P450 monooxygenase n=1 Tax=Phomopsis amygdali TaxID=1214568 RepID=UPI0022FF22F0|nr:cytochrome P450 monooxygenase [Diaporthe amygdali]KAJ0118022.1 cytochrome P450 monooxygenase [Diaporthe amygdali]
MAEWQEIFLLHLIPQIVAQVSSRVFVGQDLCRNPQWLRIAVNYTTDSVVAARVITRWPRVLQPLAHWFIPDCRKVRQHVKVARQLMRPFIQQRLQERQNKETPKEARDAIE